MTPYVVTRYYRAPEVILGMGYCDNGITDTFCCNLVLAVLLGMIRGISCVISATRFWCEFKARCTKPPGSVVTDKRLILHWNCQTAAILPSWNIAVSQPTYGLFLTKRDCHAKPGTVAVIEMVWSFESPDAFHTRDVSTPTAWLLSIWLCTNWISVSVTFLPATLLSFSVHVPPHLSLVQSHDPKSFSKFCSQYIPVPSVTV